MKKILRKKIISIRKKKYLGSNSNQILNIYKLIKKKYKNFKVIGGYIPINYEFDCLNLCKFLEKKKYNLCSGHDALKTLKILNAIRETNE